jgi:hypothetical protein
MTEKRIASFDEFWPFYMGEHATTACRVFHFIGTSIGLCCLIAAAVLLNPWFLLPGIVSGYAWAWVGHFFIEKNKPASFKYPLWSFIADWRMWSLMMRGRLWSDAPVLKQAGIEQAG